MIIFVSGNQNIVIVVKNKKTTLTLKVVTTVAMTNNLTISTFEGVLLIDRQTLYKLLANHTPSRGRQKFGLPRMPHTIVGRGKIFYFRLSGLPRLLGDCATYLLKTSILWQDLALA
jgi:hypothetical protein